MAGPGNLHSLDIVHQMKLLRHWSFLIVRTLILLGLHVRLVSYPTFRHYVREVLEGIIIKYIMNQKTPEDGRMELIVSWKKPVSYTNWSYISSDFWIIMSNLYVIEFLVAMHLTFRWRAPSLLYHKIERLDLNSICIAIASIENLHKIVEPVCNMVSA
jgi:hypothetical protein